MRRAGWRTDGLLDRQTVALQARRPYDSPIATVVGFGCHPVAAGMDVPTHSCDYPAALRLAMRRMVGGECVFLQGAAGNVLPRSSFCADEGEEKLLKAWKDSKEPFCQYLTITDVGAWEALKARAT